MVHFIFFTTLLLTILMHELGHLCAGLLCKVKVEAFSIGFFKPYIHKKWKGIDWRLTPWLIGGYCKFSGETDKSKDGLLAQPYHKKLFIILAGVMVNLIIALSCYLINYQNIGLGLQIDWLTIKAMFTNDYDSIVNVFIIYRPNLFLWQLSVINLFCCVTNAFPLWPCLDGSYIWLPLMEKVWKDNYIRNLQIVTKVGFWSLMVAQGIFIIWILVM